MNCSDAQQLLSPLFDGELKPDVRALIESHIEACPTCARELAEFKAMSDLAQSMPELRPENDVWHGLASKLDSATIRLRSERTWINKNVLLAATVLLVVGVGLVLFLNRDEHHYHMAVNFDRYLKEFIHDTKNAQAVLVTAYPNQTVGLEQAAQLLKYNPAATKELPDGYALDSVQVFEMPCCKCVQCIYKKPDNSPLVLLAQDTE